MARAPRSTSAAPRRSRKPAMPDEIADKPSSATDSLHAMIAEAAYFRAESRGFQGGDPVEDWLIAEAEINARMQSVH